MSRNLINVRLCTPPQSPGALDFDQRTSVTAAQTERTAESGDERDARITFTIPHPRSLE